MSVIAAISTATGSGGIGIIRMSGEECFQILDKIFHPKNKSKIKGYTMQYGYIIDSSSKEKIDEVLVSYFVKPKSYTTENMCEINSHGGRIVERKILEECLKNGAILANPGEFTQKAFLNGRIDLTQAESIIDIINSKTENEVKSSVQQLQGSLSSEIKNIEKSLLNIMADIEASIDYPEYDVEETTNKKISETLLEIEYKLKELSNSYKKGKIIKDGLKTVIIGRPNVGKSSLLNLLLNEDRAIVSDIEGTTRDTIEEYIDLNGIPLRIIDTAGIRKTNNEIEKIGVNKTIKEIEMADLIIAMFDVSRKCDEEDKKILNLINNKQAIILLNKCDLIKEEKYDCIEEIKDKKHIIKFSTKTKDGLEKLYNMINNMYNIKEISINEGNIITNIRQKDHIDKALKATVEAENENKKNTEVDIISIYIKNILDELCSITGENVSEDIIKEIFSKFCLGK